MALEERASDGAWRVRARALQALSSLVEQGIVTRLPERLLGGTPAEHGRNLRLRLWTYALADPSAEVRSMAVRHLEAVDDASPAVARLTQVLSSDPSGYVRRDAARTLGELGLAAARAIPALEQATESSDRHLRETAREALRKIRRR